MNKDIHIGKLVKEKFDESSLSVPEFAAALHKSRTTIYDIFSRKRHCPEFCVNGNRIQL